MVRLLMFLIVVGAVVYFFKAMSRPAQQPGPPGATA